MTTHEHAETFRNPTKVGEIFIEAIKDPVANAVALDMLVTPESRRDWGDFQQAHRWFASIQNLAYGDQPKAAVGDPDVVYMSLHRDEPVSYRNIGEDIRVGPGVITLVWRPQIDRWMVHHVGDYVRPEQVPHG